MVRAAHEASGNWASVIYSGTRVAYCVGTYTRIMDGITNMESREREPNAMVTMAECVMCHVVVCSKELGGRRFEAKIAPSDLGKKVV